MNLTKTERSELQIILTKLSSEYVEERQLGYSLFITSTFVDKILYEISKIDSEFAYMCINNQYNTVSLGPYSLLYYVLSEVYKPNDTRHSYFFNEELPALISIIRNTPRHT